MRYCAPEHLLQLDDAMLRVQGGNAEDFVLQQADRQAQVVLHLLRRRQHHTELHALRFAGDEAIRDLSRAREDAVDSRVQARHQLKGFLLRHDIRYTGKTSWSLAYCRWLSTLNFDAGASQAAFTEYWHAVEAADERVERLTKALQSSIAGWRFEPVVGALQALRGVAAITAIGLVAEIGDLARISHPRKLMGYLGLVPSEHSGGERTSRGSITKTGKAHARRLLTEAAWNYRFKARIGREALARQEGLSESIRTTAWKAQFSS